MKRVLQSLVNASGFIQENPAESRSIVAKYLGMDTALLDELSATYRFKITLDQSLLMTLENQAKWAIDNKLTDQTKVCNLMTMPMFMENPIHFTFFPKHSEIK